MAPTGFEEVVSVEHPEFKPEAGRYHLYVSKSCPFAATCYCTLLIKGLEDAIETSFAHWLFDFKERWQFTGEDGSSLDHRGQRTSTRQFYLQHHPDYTGAFSVPILFDKKTNQIVCNDTNKILKSLSTAFDEFSKTQAQKDMKLLGASEEVRIAKDEFESWFNRDCYYGFDAFLVMNKVTQEYYDSEVERMEHILDKIEAHLRKSRFLFGDSLNELTVSDMKLFVRIMWTILTAATYTRVDRFEIRIDYPAIYEHCRDVYNLFGMGPKSVDQHFIIRSHFYKPFDSEPVKPPIVPHGPRLDLTLPQNRIDRFSRK